MERACGTRRPALSTASACWRCARESSAWRGAIALARWRSSGKWRPKACCCLARLESAPHPELAERYFERSVAKVEDEVDRLGRSQELKAEYRARYQETYREYIAFLIRRGNPVRVFGVLERMRGRALLAELAERDLAFVGEQPAELRRARREIGAAYDAAAQELARLDEGQSAARPSAGAAPGPGPWARRPAACRPLH